VYRCSVSFVGRPNAGKSTLFNCILGLKAGIVSPKANTTRSATSAEYHGSYLIDTPGWDTKPRGQLGRLLVGAARSAFMSSDVVCLVLDAARPLLREDQMMYNEACQVGKPMLVVLSKTDLVKPISKLSRKLDIIQEWGYNGTVWPVSVPRRKGIDSLCYALRSLSPCSAGDGDSIVPPPITKQKFAQECVREHAFRLLNQEVPYELWVETRWMIEDQDGVCNIEQDIKVLNERHKPIILGAGGQMIKRIGSRARADLMRYWEQGVRLYLKVKVGKKADLLASCR
jgi:GTP-binding protein Era